MGRAADQSKLAASAAGIRATAAGMEVLAAVRFIDGAFFAVHGTGGDDAELIVTHSEIKMKEPVSARAAQSAETGFGLGVSRIGSDHERLVEKNLLGFATTYVVLGHIFCDVACVPFEPGVTSGVKCH